MSSLQRACCVLGAGRARTTVGRVLTWQWSQPHGCVCRTINPRVDGGLGEQHTQTYTFTTYIRPPPPVFIAQSRPRSSFTCGCMRCSRPPPLTCNLHTRRDRHTTRSNAPLLPHQQPRRHPSLPCRTPGRPSQPPVRAARRRLRTVRTTGWPRTRTSSPNRRSQLASLRSRCGSRHRFLTMCHCRCRRCRPRLRALRPLCRPRQS